MKKQFERQVNTFEGLEIDWKEGMRRVKKKVYEIEENQ